MIVQKLEDFDKEYTSKEKIKFQEREESRRQEFLKRQEERKAQSLMLKQQRCDHKWENTLFDDENGNRCIKKHCSKCFKTKIL